MNSVHSQEKITKDLALIALTTAILQNFATRWCRRVLEAHALKFLGICVVVCLGLMLWYSPSVGLIIVVCLAARMKYLSSDECPLFRDYVVKAVYHAGSAIDEAEKFEKEEKT